MKAPQTPLVFGVLLVWRGGHFVWTIWATFRIHSAGCERKTNQPGSLPASCVVWISCREPASDYRKDFFYFEIKSCQGFSFFYEEPSFFCKFYMDLNTYCERKFGVENVVTFVSSLHGSFLNGADLLWKVCNVPPETLTFCVSRTLPLLPTVLFIV